MIKVPGSVGVRYVRGVIELGERATPNALATVVARAELASRGEASEVAVRELVTARGFTYVPHGAEAETAMRLDA